MKVKICPGCGSNMGKGKNGIWECWCGREEKTDDETQEKEKSDTESESCPIHYPAHYGFCDCDR